MKNYRPLVSRLNRAHSRLLCSATILVALVAVTGTTPMWADDAPDADAAQPAFALPPWGSDRETVVDSLGPPAFATDTILMYAVLLPPTLATEDLAAVPYAADLTLWFTSGKLSYASYALPPDETAPAKLTAQFASVAALLREAYGPPASQTESAGVFITEVWNLDDTDIEHTVVLDPARRDHVVVFRAGRIE